MLEPDWKFQHDGLLGIIKEMWWHLKYLKLSSSDYLLYNDATPGEFPFVANMIRELFSDERCSGVILSSEWILTAATCLRYSTSGARFMAGEYNTSIFEGNEQSRRVSYVAFHPDLYDIE